MTTTRTDGSSSKSHGKNDQSMTSLEKQQQQEQRVQKSLKHNPILIRHQQQASFVLGPPATTSRTSITSKPLPPPCNATTLYLKKLLSIENKNIKNKKSSKNTNISGIKKTKSESCKSDNEVENDNVVDKENTIIKTTKTHPVISTSKHLQVRPGISKQVSGCNINNKQTGEESKTRALMMLSAKFCHKERKISKANHSSSDNDVSKNNKQRSKRARITSCTRSSSNIAEDSENIDSTSNSLSNKRIATVLKSSSSSSISSMKKQKTANIVETSSSCYNESRANLSAIDSSMTIPGSTSLQQKQLHQHETSTNLHNSSLIETTATSTTIARRSSTMFSTTFNLKKSSNTNFQVKSVGSNQTDRQIRLGRMLGDENKSNSNPLTNIKNAVQTICPCNDDMELTNKILQSEQEPESNCVVGSDCALNENDSIAKHCVDETSLSMNKQNQNNYSSSLIGSIDTSHYHISNNTTSNNDRRKNRNNKKNQNHNFIRLNLRNGNGSCLGAKNKKMKSKSHMKWEEFKLMHKKKHDSSNNTSTINGVNDSQHTYNSTSCRGEDNTNRAEKLPGNDTTGIDIVDDYIDGILLDTAATNNKQKSLSLKTNQAGTSSTIPFCKGHNQPCKVLTVKKSGPNHGRQFYACCFPNRNEQCNHFQWADDTPTAIYEALVGNTSDSTFVRRQVSTYMIRMKSLTVPELKEYCVKNNLDWKGKKTQLLTRLAIWVRDEVCKSLSPPSPPPPQQQQQPTTNQNRNNTDNDDNDSHGTKDNSRSLQNSLFQSNTIIDSSDQSIELNSDNDDDDDDSDDDNELEIIPSICDQQKPQQEQTSTLTNQTNQRTCNNTTTNTSTNVDLSKCSLPIVLQTLFGYTTFRHHQEWAIQRCLNKQRTLLVAPTGFGKSLCYTIPAAMMDGICIVVTPLVSLIHDQMSHVPARIPTATLSGSISSTTLASTIDDIVRGRIKIVFVSPERLTTASFRRLFRKQWNTITKQYDDRLFPNVSLLCVDEAHCISQWGNTFRPSYLRLQTAIETIQPHSVLAITATAGPRVVTDICRTLNICVEPCQLNKTDDSVRIISTNRDNIDVSCFMFNEESERLEKLIKILSSTQSNCNNNNNKASNTKTKTTVGKENNHHDQEVTYDGLLSTGSVIVYVWRKYDAERIAETIQAATTISGGVVVYHGGMDSNERCKAQSNFMRGKVRICVATVAFGLGINKTNIRGIIHMYLSSSPEQYIQEIGRAGRDGQSAHAISLLIHPNEVLVKHSLAHTDKTCSSQVRTILFDIQQRVQKNAVLMLQSYQYASNDSSRCDDNVDTTTTAQHLQPSLLKPIYISVPLHQVAAKCDCKHETIETIFNLLEQQSLLCIDGISYDIASIVPKRRSIQKLAEIEPIVKAILFCATVTESPILLDDNNTASSSSGYKNDLYHHQQEPHATTSTRPKLLVGTIYGSYTFSITECTNCISDTAEPRHVYATLRRLQSMNEIDYVLQTTSSSQQQNDQRSAITIRLTNEGMHCFGSINSETTTTTRIDELTTKIQNKLVSTVNACADKVLDLSFIMNQLSIATIAQNETNTVASNDDDNNTETNIKKSKRLVLFQHLIQQYFEAEDKGMSLWSSTSKVVVTSENDCLNDTNRLPFTSCLNDILLSNTVQNVVAHLHETRRMMDNSNSHTKDNKDDSYDWNDKDVSNVYSQTRTITTMANINDDDINHNSGNNLLEQVDHMSLLVTKFLHGLASVPGSYAIHRHHSLFGTMQTVQFDMLYKSVEIVLYRQQDKK